MSTADPLPESIGYETCPICIVDFEEGDDVRMLPCKACVDSSPRDRVLFVETIRNASLRHFSVH